MADRARHYCERCERYVVARVPHPGWRVASISAWAFFVLLAFLVGASGLLLFGGGIVVFAMGALLLGPLHARASEDPRCPGCLCVVARAAALGPSSAAAPAVREPA